jgi:hypothetical protein
MIADNPQSPFKLALASLRLALAALALVAVDGVARAATPELRIDLSVDAQRRVHASLKVAHGDDVNFFLGDDCADDDGVMPTPFRLVLDGRPVPLPVQDRALERGRPDLRRRCKPGPPSVLAGPDGEVGEVVSSPLDERSHRVRVTYEVVKQTCGDKTPWDDDPIRCWAGKVSSTELDVPAADVKLALHAPPAVARDHEIPIEVVFENRTDGALTLPAGAIMVVDDKVSVPEVEYQVATLSTLQLAPRQVRTIPCRLQLAEEYDRGRVHRLRARYIDDSDPPRRWVESTRVQVKAR